MKAGFFEILVLDQYLKSLKGAGFLSHPLNDKAYPLKVIGRIKNVFMNMGLGSRICFNKSDGSSMYSCDQLIPLLLIQCYRIRISIELLRIRN